MKILAVDDDPWICNVVVTCLARAGHEVVEAADGQAAWEAWQGEHFRMMITDWMMPVVNGPELIRRIRAENWPSYTYVILLTVKDAKEDVVTGLEVGADDYMTKPFSLDELRARVVVGERILNLESRLSKSRDRLERLATYDGLTGLLNRWAIEEHAEAELSRVRREGGSVSLILLDLDYFKEINDQHGHLAGDQALRLVATLLVQNVRPYDWVGRWGGDEFLIVLPETRLPEASVVVERVRAAMAAARLTLPDDTGTIQMRVSIWVTNASVDSGALPSRETLLRQADEALYRAKREGRNRAALYMNVPALPSDS